MSASVNMVGPSAGRSLRFKQHSNFQKVLNERVMAYLHNNHLPARDVPAMYLISALVLAWWLAAYLLLLLGHFPPLVNVILCLVWTMAIITVGLNITHDANHDGYSNHPWVNKLLSLSAELLGFSGFRWRIKHNVWHHTYTNISGYDDDVETYGVLRLTPRAPWRPLFKLQAWYFWLVYSFIGFDFIFRDLLMAWFGKSDDNHIYPKMSTADKVTFWVGKLFFFVIMIGLPLLVYPWWQVLIGFMIVVLTIGLALGIFFQLAHINVDAAFPQTVGKPPHIDNEWAIHQVETTVDFAPHNWFLNFYIGGLNYQIEHHLFPHICHLNYPRLAPIVRATCEEFGIRYNCYATWREAFASHWNEIRNLGRNA